MELSDSIEFRPSVHFFRQTFTKKKGCLQIQYSFVSLSYVYLFLSCFTNSESSGSAKKSLSYSPDYLFLTSLCYPSFCTKIGMSLWKCHVYHGTHLVYSLTKVQHSAARTHSLQFPCKNNLELLRRKDKTSNIIRNQFHFYQFNYWHMINTFYTYIKIICNKYDAFRYGL